MSTEQRVVIGMDPHKRSVTIEVMTADETVLGGDRFGTDVDGFAAMRRYVSRFAATGADRVWAVEGCSGSRRCLPNFAGIGPPVFSDAACTQAAVQFGANVFYALDNPTGKLFERGPQIVTTLYFFNGVTCDPAGPAHRGARPAHRVAARRRARSGRDGAAAVHGLRGLWNDV